MLSDSALNKEQTNQKILDLHQNLKYAMEAFDQISKDYLHLCQQLHGGYLTADAIIPANEKFTKLTKILASVAKTAEDLNCLDSKYRVEKQLARGIRSMAIRYYENNRILPTPPSMKKYLQKQRVRVINEKRRKFQREREGQGNSNKNLQLDSFVSKHKGGEASSATGSIDQNSNGIDPIQQQIDYVSNLIYEAEAQGRTDEMKLLQQNLQSLMNFQENSSVTSESTTNSCVGIGFGVEKDLIFFKINCPPKNTKKKYPHELSTTNKGFPCKSQNLSKYSLTQIFKIMIMTPK